MKAARRYLGVRERFGDPMKSSLWGRASSQDFQASASINTTPLVDVMLVLLIVFLIAVPVALNSVEIRLPVFGQSPTQVNPHTQVIGLMNDGTLYWGRHLVSLEQLEEQLVLLSSRDQVSAIQIRAEAEVSFHDVNTVLRLADSHSIGAISLATRVGSIRP